MAFELTTFEEALGTSRVVRGAVWLAVAFGRPCLFIPNEMQRERTHMTKPEKGDVVRIHYTGRLEDGTQFDSSEGRDPLQFELGTGQIIAGLDRQIAEMDEGAKETLTIPAAEAYGEHRPEQVQSLPRTAIPSEIDPQPGMQLQATTQTGQPVPIVVTEVGDDTVTVDANHPLAGRDLVFDVELVEIIKAA